MGTSKSAAEFSARIVRLATVTQANQKVVVTNGALLAKEIILGEFAARGVSKDSRIAGAKWGVGFDVKGFNNPSALVRVRGPVQLVDSPTKPHTIRPRRGRRGGKKALAFNGVVKASAQHPGTKGKRAFPAAKTKARIAVPRVMGQRVIGGWRAALR